MIDHKELRRLASEYEAAGKAYEDARFTTPTYEVAIRVGNAFRASASPSVVLALLDEVESLRKDAERYRWLRDQRWYSSKLFVVSGGRETVRLGTDCPSLDRLDTAIDAAMQAKEEG